MNNEKKLSRREVATMLHEAMQPFCEPLKDLRPALAEPFRQKDDRGQDYVMASDGHVLISIHARQAGVAVSPFRQMDEFKALKAIPTVGFEDMLKSRYVSRQDIATLIGKMQQHEAEQKQLTTAKVGDVRLSVTALSHIETAMRICGATVARLVWAKDSKVVLQMDNAKGQHCVTVLHMGFDPNDARDFMLPTAGDVPAASACINWQQGLAEWTAIKAELAAREEAERMARREVWLVDVVKRGYVPVYARTADEARRILDKHWIDPEDDGDDEWMLGDYVPEAEDLDDLDDCYETIVTAEGSKTRDEIYEMEKISLEYEQAHGKGDTSEATDSEPSTAAAAPAEPAAAPDAPASAPADGSGQPATEGDTSEADRQHEQVVESLANMLRTTPFTSEFKVVKQPKGIRVVIEVTQEQMNTLMQQAKRKHEQEGKE